MAHRAHRRNRRAPQKPAPTTVKEVCPSCGYSAAEMLKGKSCPMCLPCPRCGRKLMQCVCIEGE